MKRGQITMFMVVALILFLIFFFLYKLYASSSDDVGLEDAVKIQSDMTQLRNVVEDCLDNAADEGLRTLGKQGGVIYLTQAPDATGLEYELTPYVESLGSRLQIQGLNSLYVDYGQHILPWDDGNVSVKYGVKRETSVPIPRYPYPGSLVKNPGSYPFSLGTDNWNWNTLYQFSLYALCDSRGPNAFNDLERAKPGYISDQDCETVAASKSAQKFLRNYVNQKVKECFESVDDKSVFESEDYEIEELETGVFIGEKDVLFNTRFPIKKKSGSNFEMMKFSVKKNVRLRKVYDFVNHLILEDARDYSFDMANLSHYKKLSGYWDVDLSVDRKKDVCTLQTLSPSCTPSSLYDDMITVTDEASFIDAEPFKFSFGVRNRVPALDEIDKVKPPNDLERYDIVVVEGQQIVIDPYGYDPDDNNNVNCGTDVSGNPIMCMEDKYFYRGWKADYDDVYTRSADNEYITKHGGAALSPLFRIFDGTDNRLPEYYDDVSTCGAKCTSLTPNEWHDSGFYISTRRKASYTPGVGDIGPHIVRVYVCDEAVSIPDDNRCDYQDIKILVAPLSGGAVTPMFPTIPEGHISYEDPFTLALDNDLPMYDLTTGSFEWWDYCEPNNPVLIKGGIRDSKATFEFVPDIMNPEHGNPINYLNNPIICTSDSEERLRLVYRDNLDVETLVGNFELYVHYCLPYTGPGVYPYDDGLDLDLTDDFMYDHKCCQANGPPTNVNSWGVYNPGIECFSDPIYRYLSFYDYKSDYSASYIEVEIPNADKNMYELGNPPKASMLIYGSNDYLEIINPQSPQSDMDNDIIERTFKQSCGSHRGNTCTGALTNEGNIISCNDLSGTEDERCEGPSRTQSDTPGPNCHPYTSGESFELTYKNNGHTIGVIDGICNNRKRCSAAADSYNDGDIYLNQAECDGSGGCTQGVDSVDCSTSEAGYQNFVGSENKIMYCPGECVHDFPDDRCQTIDNFNQCTDLDFDENLCNNYPGTPILGFVTTPFDNPLPGKYDDTTTKECCGDDDGEYIPRDSIYNLLTFCCPYEYGRDDWGEEVCLESDNDFCDYSHYPSISIDCGGDTICSVGETMQVTITNLKDCNNRPYYIQLDADNSICNVEFDTSQSNVGMKGIYSNLVSPVQFSSNSVTFNWPVPTIPADCQNVVMSIPSHLEIGIFYDPAHKERVFYSNNVLGGSFSFGT